MKKIYLIGLFITLLNAFAVAPAIAESDNPNINIAASFGSNGLNISAARRINDYVGARLDISTGSEVSRSGKVDDNEYAAIFTPKTNGLLLDVSPFAGDFYITAGLMQQDIKLSINAKSKQQYTFNGNTYSLDDDIQSINGNAGFDRSSAPYFGLGWSNRYYKAVGFTYSFDVGVLQVGSPQTTMSVECTSGGIIDCAKLRADIAVEEDEINKNIADGDLLYPIITLGLGYSF